VRERRSARLDRLSLLDRPRWRQSSEAKGAPEMASVKLIPEEEATGKVKDLYEEIKAALGTDFVPNLYKAMALNPEYLEANWRRDNAVMSESHRLDPLTKEIIAVAVSAVNNCDY
jgi:alkylhydroperoxidase family enzyme